VFGDLRSGLPCRMISCPHRRFALIYLHYAGALNRLHTPCSPRLPALSRHARRLRRIHHLERSRAASVCMPTAPSIEHLTCDKLQHRGATAYDPHSRLFLDSIVLMFYIYLDATCPTPLLSNRCHPMSACLPSSPSSAPPTTPYSGNIGNWDAQSHCRRVHLYAHSGNNGSPRAAAELRHSSNCPTTPENNDPRRFKLSPTTSDSGNCQQLPATHPASPQLPQSTALSAPHPLPHTPILARTATSGNRRPLQDSPRRPRREPATPPPSTAVAQAAQAAFVAHGRLEDICGVSVAGSSAGHLSRRTSKADKTVTLSKLASCLDPQPLPALSADVRQSAHKNGRPSRCPEEAPIALERRAA
jgi:hypothetical protein